MKNVNLNIKKQRIWVCFFLITIFLSSCHVSQSFCFGEWKYGTDKISFKENNRFTFEKVYFSNKSDADTNSNKKLVKYYDGKWYLSKNVIYLSFNDSVHGYSFYRCKTLRVTTNPLMKRALMSNTCYIKTPAPPAFFSRVSKQTYQSK